MTNEQLNEEICKWLGWTVGEPTSGNGAYHWRNEKKYMPGYYDQRPSYIDDPEALDNMHSAEEKLTDKQRGQYSNALWNNNVENRDYEHAPYWFLIHLTARQRATALLRVVKPKLFR